MEFSAEQKAAIDAMIEEATAGLVAKNQQLLAEKKKLQKNAKIDPQTVADLEDQVEKLQGDLTASQKAAKDATKAAEAAANQLKAESGFTQKLLIDNGLTDALVKAGVAAPYINAAKSMFAGQAQIVADGESRVAKIGDKALQDFVKEWAVSDEGKHFIAAPQNGGGGSQGGSDSNKPAKVDISNLRGAAKLEAARAQTQK